MSCYKPPYRVTEKDDVFKNAKVKFLPDGYCRVTAFSRKVFKGVGYEEIKTESYNEEMLLLLQPEKKQPERAEAPATRADSFKRSKDKIFEIAAANNWSYMVTFTMDDCKVDRYDENAVYKAFSTWAYNQAKRNGLIGLFIPEFHKDKAIHLHGLVNNALPVVHSGTYKIKGEKKPVGLKKLKSLGLTPDDESVQDVYNVDNYNLGFSTAVRLDGNVTSVAFYMTKYCTKDLQRIFGNYYLAVGKPKRNLPFCICNMDIEDLKKYPKANSVKLPDNLGEVVYTTITIDDFEGCEIL